MSGGMTLKDKAVLAIGAMAVLYLVAGALAFTVQKDAWKRARDGYARAKAKYLSECELISERRQWDESYENERSRMPMFEEGEATDTAWSRKIGAMAQDHHVAYTQFSSEKVEKRGEVIELPLQVKSWEASLESLVRFIHELENTDSGMFDVKTIQFKPSNKKGFLKGSLGITCAYMWKKED